jgi:HPt (histidine-containing phosphotransfer) domain-containing protein
VSALNPKVIQELRSLDAGAPGLLKELIDLFLREAGVHLAGLRTALEKRDARALERSAHTLKGSSGNLGAMAMARICGELQARGGSPDWDRIPGELSQLEEEFRKAKSELEAERERS